MSWEPQAGGRVGWELGRRGEEGPGRPLAAGPLPSLSKPATPSHQTLFRAQASPPLSLWARQGFGERAGGGGQAEACPPQGNQPPPLRIPLRRTATGDHRREERGEGMEEREKILEGGGSALTRTFSLHLLSPLTALEPQQYWELGA